MAPSIAGAPTVSRAPTIAGAFVLCAGYGTRLRPMTELCPKPLVPVVDRPVLDYTLAWLRRLGVQKVVFNAHHLATELEAYLHAADFGDMRFHYNFEPDILGTAGGLRAVAHHFCHDELFLMINGDILVDMDIGQVIQDHVDAGRVATMVLTEHGAAGAGLVASDRDGGLVRLAGYLPAESSPSDGEQGTFTGIHILSSRFLELLTASDFDINRQVYPRALRRDLRVGARLAQGYWRDMGTISSYIAANFEVLAGIGPERRVVGEERIDRTELRFFGADVALDETSMVGKNTIVGRGVSVAGGASTMNAVLWPRSVVTAGAKMHGGILLPNGVWIPSP